MTETVRQRPKVHVPRQSEKIEQNEAKTDKPKEKSLKELLDEQKLVDMNIMKQKLGN